jgi:hypothetical protein
MDLLKTLYEVLGSSYPRLSILVAAVLGALIFGGSWWLIGKQYEKEQRESGTVRTADPQHPQPLVLPKPSEPPARPPESRAAGREKVPPATAAEEAAEHYRRTSATLKKDEIRQGYATLCDRIADRIGLKSWAPVNQLTRMIDTNLGDAEAFGRAETELPGSALVALRVLVAFETPRERPMYMSYVFIGRTTHGDEVVAMLNESREWSILSKASQGRADHEELLTQIVKRVLQRLTERIAPDIRRLR